MRYPFKIGVLALLLAGIFSGSSIAQSGTATAQRTAVAVPDLATRFDGEKGVFVPKWKADMPVSSLADLNKMVFAPWFEGGSLDHQVVNLPYYDLVVPVSATEALAIASATAEGVEELSTDKFQTSMAQSEISPDVAWYPASHVILGEREIRRGQHFQHVLVYPIRVNRSGNRLQKAKSVSYRLSRKRGAYKSTTSSAKRIYNNNSVLATGTWYKMNIVKDGLYKLDYNYLQSIGIDPASINPSTIRIHGNGGGMLPQTAGKYPHDDLVENNIWVSGQSDGSFDQGDYILFYGKGPHTWKYIASLDRFVHQYNVYSDSAAYFLTWGNGLGKRITTQAVSGSPVATPITARKMGFYEKDSFNPLKSGRSWLGESFDLTTTKTFSINTPHVASGTNAKVTVRLAAQSNSPSNFSIRESNNTYASVAIVNTNSNIYGSAYYRHNFTTFEVPASRLGDSSVDVELTYSKPLTSSVGYLDFIEAEYQYNLNLSGNNTMFFSVADNVGPGKIFQYNMGSGNNYRVWDVTNPVEVVERSMNGGSFITDADSVKRFLAFNGANLLTPVSTKRINNQNLHSLAQTDYVIITHGDFASAANTLASFHRSHFGRDVHV
ncbi:MAG TPA: hypothetical protein ENJ82_12995, partial [Bacteroidetes bacterium]|nr:hypothetical protein [Bacteroidota bacterium]